MNLYSGPINRDTQVTKWLDYFFLYNLENWLTSKQKIGKIGLKFCSTLNKPTKKYPKFKNWPKFAKNLVTLVGVWSSVSYIVPSPNGPF